MESEHPLLKFIPNGREDLRKLYKLDSPSRLQEAITILDDWIKKQNHFTKKDFPNERLEAVLITCKGSIEKAKKQIDKLCTLRTLLPMYFKIINIREELADVLYNLIVLPMVTEDNYRVALNKVEKSQLYREKYMQFYKLVVIMSEYLTRYDYVKGFVFIHDFRDVNIVDLVTCINTTELQQILTILIEAYGARLQGIHILTPSKTIDLLIKIAKPILSEKIMNRVHVHPTIEDLHKHINKDILPIEYGGKKRSYSELCVDWINELCSPDHQNYLKTMSQARTDESLRLLDKFNEEYLGMAGTFRTLTVD